MRTIAILKKVIDIIYEEKRLDDVLHNRVEKEKEYAEKDSIIAELYRINIQLEHKIKQYDRDFEVLTLLNRTDDKETDKKETDKKETDKKEETTTEKPHVHVKKSRREYMAEYQKRYRRKQKEKKIEMTL